MIQGKFLVDLMVEKVLTKTQVGQVSGPGTMDGPGLQYYYLSFREEGNGNKERHREWEWVRRPKI